MQNRNLILNTFQIIKPFAVSETRHTKPISTLVCFLLKKLAYFCVQSIVVLNWKNNQCSKYQWIVEEYKRNTLPHYAKASRGTLRN